MAGPHAKLQRVLLLSLLNLVARCSAAKRRKAHEEHEEEEEEGLSGYTAGLATIGGFLVVMAIFYLINAQRTVVRKTIWEVVNNTISIFCAVFIYQTCHSFMVTVVYDPVMHLFKQDSERKQFEVLRYVNQFEVVFWYGMLYLNVSVWSGVGQGMMSRMSTIKDKLAWAKDRNGVRIGMIFAHVCAFATMEGWGMVQNSEFRRYRSSPAKSLVCFGEAFGKWFVIFIVLGAFRRIVKYRYIQYWRKGQQVVLHYPHGHPRFRKYHGLVGVLEEYNLKEKTWLIDVKGKKDKVNVMIDHIGAFATVTADLDEANEKRRQSTVTHHMGTRASDWMNSREKVVKKFLESGAVGFNAHQRSNIAMAHQHISGHHVEDDNRFKKGDEVIVLGSHHRDITDPRRYVPRLAVVQKTCRDANGRLKFVRTDTESVRETHAGNVNWDRLELKDRNLFKEGPYPYHDPMVKYWEEQLEEGENDIAALVVSFLLVQSMRFWIGGYLPGPTGVEPGHGKDDPLFEKSVSQVAQLYGCAFLLMVCALVHPFVFKKNVIFRELKNLHLIFHKKRVDQAKTPTTSYPYKYLFLEELFEGLKRMEEVIFNVYCFAMSWAFMYATQWSICRMELISKHSRHVVSILLAINVTISVFVVIYLIDKSIHWAHGSDSIDGTHTDAIEKNMLCLMHSLGFLLGFTWEMCFDEALEQVAETWAGESNHWNHLAKTVLSIIFLVTIIPPWKRFIIPMIDEKEYTLGFHVHRVNDNVKHAFVKAHMEHKTKEKLEHERKAEEWDLEDHGHGHKYSDAQKDIRRVSRHLVRKLKLMDHAFEYRCRKKLQPKPEELSNLSNTKRYIERMLSEADKDVHHPDSKLDRTGDHKKELESIMRAFKELSHRRKAIHYTFKYRFKYKKSGQDREEDIKMQEQEEMKDCLSREIGGSQRQASKESRVSRVSDPEEEHSSEEKLTESSSSEEESDSGEEKHGFFSRMVMSVLDPEDGKEFKKRKGVQKGTRDLVASPPACRESQQILARADKLVEDYDKLWEDLKSLHERVDTKLESMGP